MMKIPSIGDPIIDSPLFDLKGEGYTLSDFLERPILLCFWSTTCMICMKSMGELKSTYEKHKDKVNLVSINVDEDHDTWEHGSRRDNIEWANLSDGQGSGSGIAYAYGVFAHPAYVLINTQGIIMDRWMGYKRGQFEEKLKQCVNQPGQSGPFPA